MPIDAVKELLASRNEAHHALTVCEASSKGDVACRSGAIPPAMRPWALELCQADPEAFDGVLKVTPGFGDLFEKHSPPSEAQTARKQFADATLALCRQFDIDPEALDA